MPACRTESMRAPPNTRACCSCCKPPGNFTSYCLQRHRSTLPLWQGLITAHLIDFVKVYPSSCVQREIGEDDRGGTGQTDLQASLGARSRTAAVEEALHLRLDRAPVLLGQLPSLRIEPPPRVFRFLLEEGVVVVELVLAEQDWITFPAVAGTPQRGASNYALLVSVARRAGHSGLARLIVPECDSGFLFSAHGDFDGGAGSHNSLAALGAGVLAEQR